MGFETSNDRPVALQGLALSERLFEEQGLALLDRLGMLDECAVACVGSTSQNAAMDDEVSRDHFWGPYLTFLLSEDTWRLHGGRLKQALRDLPDRVEDAAWRGYDGPEPRRTDVFEFVRFLSDLTGYREPPRHAIDWLPHLTEQGFLGRRWTERLHPGAAPWIHFNGHAVTPGRVVHPSGLPNPELRRPEPPPETYYYADSSVRFDEPFFFGTVGGLTYSVLFPASQRQFVRFVVNPLAPAFGGPAWDFFWVIPSPVAGKTYTLRMRVVLRPFAGIDDTLAAYRTYVGNMSPST